MGSDRLSSGERGDWGDMVGIQLEDWEEGEEESGFGSDFQDITSLLLQDSASPPSSNYKKHLCSPRLKICVSSSPALIVFLLLLLYLASRETDKEINSLTNLMIDLSE